MTNDDGRDYEPCILCMLMFLANHIYTLDNILTRYVNALSLLSSFDAIENGISPISQHRRHQTHPASAGTSIEYSRPSPGPQTR